MPNALRAPWGAVPPKRADFAAAQVIGLPRAIPWYRYGAMWKAFFEALGRRVVTSPVSDRDVLERGQKLSVDETCLASKLFLGHVEALCRAGVDAVFVPSLADLGRGREFCTKFSALPDLVANAFAVGRADGATDACPRVLSCLVEEKHGGRSERDAFVGVAERLGATRREGLRAYEAGKAAQRAHDARLAVAQDEVVGAALEAPAGTRPLLILLAGHPYVAHDPLMGGVVADALRAQGATVLYADETDRERAWEKSREFSETMPWLQNRELCGSVLLRRGQVDGVVLVSAYPCGPDSMTDDALQRADLGCPVLVLTVDAQSGSAGLETRVESFVDILSYQRKGGYLHGNRS